MLSVCPHSCLIAVPQQLFDLLVSFDHFRVMDDDLSPWKVLPVLRKPPFATGKI